MLYDIGLRLTQAYDQPAVTGRHLLRLTPAELPGRQRVVASTLTVTPKPDEWINQIDFFGNAVVIVSFATAHAETDFSVKARIERYAEIQGLDISPPMSRLAQEIADNRSLAPASPHHFVGPSSRAPSSAAMTAYAKDNTDAGMTVRETVRALGEALHRDLKFDPDATTVDTPAEQAFENRHGVCQDFTHIMISCLRGIGVPAGYVSGCLRTDPPKGQPRLEGADAMHAWVSAWCGREGGWVEYDPTNAMFAGTDHINFAYGRDYSDTAPVKGALRTSGAQTTEHAVDVIPVV